MSDFNSIASFNEEFGGDLVLQVHGTNSMPEWDLLKTEKLVMTIESSVLQILGNTFGTRSEKYTSSYQIIAPILHDLRIRAMTLDRVFNPPPREEWGAERSGPSICVYGSSGDLLYVNSEYLRLAWIDSADIAKKLAHQGELIDHIYAPETATEIQNFVATIKENGGYSGKVFPLKNNKSARWTSLLNQIDGWSVRVAEDVTGIALENIPQPIVTDMVQDIPFHFTQLTDSFCKTIEDIITIPPSVDLFLKQLKYFAHIGDIIVDKWPFLITIKQGDVFVSMNKNYVATTGYACSELDIQNPILYWKNEKELINKRIASLHTEGHYYDTFRMLTKDGGPRDVAWDTFRLSPKNVDPMTTVRVGSMIESADAINAMEELKELNAILDQRTSSI